MSIRINVIDQDGNRLGMGEGAEEAYLIYAKEYAEGDKIEIDVDQLPGHYILQLDEAKGSSLAYLTDKLTYRIPFGSDRICLSPKCFFGDRHLIHVRVAKEYEYKSYGNLARNVYDQHGQTNCYPHASANVETRGEAVFAALNAIDGITVASGHGEWPYGSWGINQDLDACLELEFGRKIRTDRIILYTRADFPHDNWWEQATITFSDGGSMELKLRKTGDAQEFVFEEKETEWIKIDRLIQSEDPSPFPALTQIEVYGVEKSSDEE